MQEAEKTQFGSPQVTEPEFKALLQQLSLHEGLLGEITFALGLSPKRWQLQAIGTRGLQVFTIGTHLGLKLEQVFTCSFSVMLPLWPVGQLCGRVFPESRQTSSQTQEPEIVVN